MNSPTTIPSHLTPDAAALKDRVVLVTGASGTMGRVAALAAARAGATVILHGRKEARLSPLYDAIAAEGHAEPAMVVLDFLTATERDYKGLAETIFAGFQRLDGIVHAASHVAPLTPMALCDADNWQAHQTINAAAPLAVTRACLPMLKRAPASGVVFLGEHHAIPVVDRPRAYWGAYAAAKSALHFAVQVWRDELAADAPPKLYWYVPGPVATQSRAVTHPGELATSLPPADSLAGDIVALVAADGCISADSPVVSRVAESVLFPGVQEDT